MSKFVMWFRRTVLRQHFWEFPQGRFVRVEVLDPITFVNRREALAAKLRGEA